MRGNPENPADWYAFGRRDLEKARKDLLAGESLYAVLLLQQAAEKLLKGKMVEVGEKPGENTQSSVSANPPCGFRDGSGVVSGDRRIPQLRIPC